MTERLDQPTIDPAVDQSGAKPKFDRRAHCQQIGSKGGQATVRSHGRGYMKMLGKTGFAAYAENHHDGNRAAAYASLYAMKPRTFSKRKK